MKTPSKYLWRSYDGEYNFSFWTPQAIFYTVSLRNAQRYKNLFYSTPDFHHLTRFVIYDVFKVSSPPLPCVGFLLFHRVV